MKTKKMTTIAMLCALSYVIMVVGRIPVVMFLKYDPKDVIIAIGGFIFGPMSAFIISFVVSVLEMITVSDTGVIGLVMNVLSSCAFACTAAYVYKKNKTAKGAVTGLVLGCILATLAMLLWNYLITPIYMGYPREAVAKMLLPVFLPFNLLKSGINTAFTLLLYKPVVTTLRRKGFVEGKGTNETSKKTGVVLIALILLVTCVFFILVMKGIL